MGDLFTDRARRVMEFANAEAKRFNHDSIGPEHMLLGLIREGTGVGATTLIRLGVNLDEVRREVEELMKPGPAALTIGKLPMTPRAKKVVEYAMEEEDAIDNGYVGTEHLLLGLIRAREGIAARVLQGQGVTLEDARAGVVAVLAAGRASPDGVAGGATSGMVVVAVRKHARPGAGELWTLELVPGHAASLRDPKGEVRHTATPEEAAQTWIFPNAVNHAFLTLPTGDGSAHFRVTREGAGQARAFVRGGMAAAVSEDEARISKREALAWLVFGVCVVVGGIVLSVVNIASSNTRGGVGVGVIVVGVVLILRHTARFNDWRSVEREHRRRGGLEYASGAPETVAPGPVTVSAPPRGPHPARVVVWGTMLAILAGLAVLVAWATGWIGGGPRAQPPPPPPAPGWTPPATPATHPTAPAVPAGLALSGAVEWDELATSVRPGHLVSADKVWLIVEGENSEIFAPVHLDAASPGTVRAGAPGTPGTLSAGRVNCYLLHVDAPDGATARLEGSITFDAPILGIIVEEASLDASDDALGREHMTYPHGGNRRGWFDGSTDDWITISADRKTLSFRSDTARWVDQVRVVTEGR